MMLYDIDMKTIYGDGYLFTKENKTDLYEIDPEYPNLCKSIGRSDVIRVLNGYFLFSKKLKDILSNDKSFKFNNVNIFYKKKLLSNDYYLVKVTNKIELVDYKNSIITGNPFFDKLVFKLENIEEHALVVSDKDDDYYVYYTENFRELVKSHDIDIDLLEIF
ncbi:imm11 family protein [Avibacterium avium]|uniref:imm11 family protein n=1 Tax=Avibacterium avium TaxID=751 RepID=UPI0039FC8226